MVNLTKQYFSCALSFFDVLSMCLLCLDKFTKYIMNTFVDSLRLFSPFTYLEMFLLLFWLWKVIYKHVCNLWKILAIVPWIIYYCIVYMPLAQNNKPNLGSRYLMDSRNRYLKYPDMPKWQIIMLPASDNQVSHLEGKGR